MEHFETTMSDADALMWNVEKDPLLRSTIVTVVRLDRSPSWDRLLDRIDRGAYLIPRLRQRVVTPFLRLGPPHWSADPHFDLAYHLRRVRAPEPATFETVLALARTVAMASFDRARPLWEFTLVDGLDDGGAALILKVHHSMTDGVGGMRLAMMLFDLERDPGDPGPAGDVEPLETYTPFGLVGPALEFHRDRALGFARRGLITALETPRRVAARPPRRHRADRGGRRFGGAHARPRAHSPVADHDRAHVVAPARHARTAARRPQARRQGGRRHAQRRVRRRGGRRHGPLPRASRPGARRPAHDDADQRAPRRRRAGRQPVHAGALPRAALAHRSGRADHDTGRTREADARRAGGADDRRARNRAQPAAHLGDHRPLRGDAQGRRLRHQQRARRPVPGVPRGRRARRPTTRSARSAGRRPTSRWSRTAAPAASASTPTASPSPTATSSWKRSPTGSPKSSRSAGVPSRRERRSRPRCPTTSWNRSAPALPPGSKEGAR